MTLKEDAGGCAPEEVIVLLPMVREDGLIYFYTSMKKSQIDGLIEDCRMPGLDTVRYRRCGNVAPGVSRWAFDLEKQ